MAQAEAPSPSDVTRLLLDASGGNREAFDQLFPLVYDELRRIAGSKLRMERAGHTLNATALVHEVYMGLVKQEDARWQGRHQFFAIAALAMRRVLMDYARAKKRKKRGAGAEVVSLDGIDGALEGEAVFDEDQATNLLALDEALDRLTAFNPEGAEVVQYRFFAGLKHEEIAEVTGVSEVTVRRRWAAAKAWLQGQLGPETMK